MKVVINKCFGGFGLSYEAVLRYAELSGFRLYPWLGHVEKKVYGKRAILGNRELLHHYSRVPVDDLPRNKWDDPDVPNDAYWSDSQLDRTDPILVRVVEEMGSERASGQYGHLAIVDIPDGTDYEIEEYDGREHIAEVHRTWA